jgi:hypothetical protein
MPLTIKITLTKTHSILKTLENHHNLKKKDQVKNNIDIFFYSKSFYQYKKLKIKN